MIVRNWKYQTAYDKIGNLSITEGQFMTGNILGVIVEGRPLEYGRSNVADASSYEVPVRIKLVDPFNGNNAEDIISQIKGTLPEFEMEGCRAVITSGGRLGFFDKELRDSSLMALSTPLVALEFLLTSISSDKGVGIINDLSDDENLCLLRNMGYGESIIKRCVFNQNLSMMDDIAAVIWDKPYGYDGSISMSRELPVYDILKISKLITHSVMQIPYQGVI